MIKDDISMFLWRWSTLAQQWHDSTHDAVGSVTDWRCCKRLVSGPGKRRPVPEVVHNWHRAPWRGSRSYEASCKRHWADSARRVGRLWQRGSGRCGLPRSPVGRSRGDLEWWDGVGRLWDWTSAHSIGRNAPRNRGIREQIPRKINNSFSVLEGGINQEEIILNHPPHPQHLIKINKSQ